MYNKLKVTNLLYILTPSTLPLSRGLSFCCFKGVCYKSFTRRKKMSVQEVASILGVDTATISRHAQKMGLTKNGIKTVVTQKGLNFILKNFWE